VTISLRVHKRGNGTLANNGITPSGHLRVGGKPTEHSTVRRIEGCEGGLSICHAPLLYFGQSIFTNSLSCLISVPTTAVLSNSLSVWITTIYYLTLKCKPLGHICSKINAGRSPIAILMALRRTLSSVSLHRLVRRRYLRGL
jgi:hypothetical protein